MKKNVLIFDDDLDILQICSIVLKRKGLEVCTESSCADLINKIKQCQPEVILMDNQIPDIGGIKATNLIKDTESISKIPVIFFSANPDIAMLAQQAGSEYYLQKPFDINELEKMVLKAVDEN